jgi:hypothetical protein
VRRTLLFGVATAIATVVACSSFSGTSPPETPDAGAPDAGIDAQPQPQQLQDAAPEAAPAPFVCDASLCDDFEGTTVGAGWKQGTQIANSGVLKFTTPGSNGAGHALTTTTTASGGVIAELSTTGDAPVGKVFLSFDVKLADDNVIFAVVDFDPGQAQLVALGTLDHQLTVAVNGAVPEVAVIPFDKWVHIDSTYTWQVTADSNFAEVTVTVDGAAEIHHTFVLTQRGPTVQARVGVEDTGATHPPAVELDNVALTFQ